MHGQALDSIPGIKDKEAKAAKLDSKRSTLGSVIWATAICYKRKVDFDLGSPIPIGRVNSCTIQHSGMISNS